MTLNHHLLLQVINLRLTHAHGILILIPNRLLQVALLRQLQLAQVLVVGNQLLITFLLYEACKLD